MLSIVDTVFDSNTAGMYGGAWSGYGVDDTLTLTNCVFSNNTASVGTHTVLVDMLACPLFMTLADVRCMVLCTESGGAGVIDTWGTAILTNVTFSNNQALGTAGEAPLVDMEQLLSVVYQLFSVLGFARWQALQVYYQVVLKGEASGSSAARP